MEDLVALCVTRVILEIKGELFVFEQFFSIGRVVEVVEALGHESKQLDVEVHRGEQGHSGGVILTLQTYLNLLDQAGHLVLCQGVGVLGIHILEVFQEGLGQVIQSRGRVHVVGVAVLVHLVEVGQREHILAEETQVGH